MGSVVAVCVEVIIFPVFKDFLAEIMPENPTLTNCGKIRHAGKSDTMK